MVHHCRLFGLPDLNQSIPYVRNELIRWITGLIDEFGFDGIRIDTMPYISNVSTKQYYTHISGSKGGIRLCIASHTGTVYL